MVSYIKRRTKAKSIWKQDPEEYFSPRGIRMGMEKAPHEELHSFYRSHNEVRMIKPRILRWADM
jgi:hypothetical protein